jgi:PAS domain S-box-containing protein
MSKKQLQSRLESLFSDLEQEHVPLYDSHADNLPGWAWACDSQGRFTDCSPAIHNYLGLQPDELIGNSLTDFHLTHRSSLALKNAIQKGEDYPIEISLEYLAGPKNQSLPVTMHIFPAPAQNGNLPGWHGFTQVLAETEDKPSWVEPPSPASKEQTETPESSLELIPAPEWPKAPDMPMELTVRPDEGGQVVESDDLPASVRKDSSQIDRRVMERTVEDSASSVLALTLSDTVQKSNLLFEIVDDTHNRLWSEDERLLVEQVADQLSLALENARLFQETQNALSESEALYNASAELNAANDYNEILEILCKYTLLEKIDKTASLNLFDHPWRENDRPGWVQTIAYHSFLPKGAIAPRYPLDAFPAADSLLSPDSATQVEDVVEDPRLDENSRALYGLRFQAASTIFAPLMVAGQWIGFVNGVFGVPTQYSPGEVRRLMALASQAAIAIQNMRLLEESRWRANQLQTAAEIARDTSSTLALDTLLRRTVNLIRDRFGYYHASIFLLDESGENAIVRESSGEAGQEMKQRGHSLAVGSLSVIGYVTEKGQALVVNDVSRDPIHAPNPLLPDTRSEAGLPLKIAERIIGALDVQSADVNAFTEDEISVLQVLADQIAVAVDNARSYEISQKAVEEMRELDRLKSQFLANMSHELRTPLNSIIGFSRVILKGIDGEINDQQHQDLNAIYNSGQHLLGLINDVLDLSKIEAGKMELAFEEDVNLVDLINSVMSTLVGLVKDKPIKLYREIDPNLPLMRADPMKVRQVLINLFSNAAKFTTSGSITVRAGVQAAPHGGEEIIISVIDTGSGIAPEDQSRLFQPFSQVDGSLTRKTGGTGLGLSICRHLVEMHGGRIGLQSQPGQGSHFFFTLPLSTVGNLQPDQDGEKVVLAVDDDPQVIGLYQRYLSKHGYRVVPLTDPDQALERARELQPFAITLDIMMPGLDGWQVLQKLKTSPDTRQIPVIVCSILGNQKKGFSLGATNYLMKPILEEDMVAAINQLNAGGEIADILVISGKPEERELLQETFAFQEKYHLHLVEDISKALVVLGFKRPDAIIMDAITSIAAMPELDGFTLLETLRGDAYLRDIPVVVYAASELGEAQLNRLSEFPQTMLRKGLIEEKELLESLQKVLGRFNPQKSGLA